MLNIRDKILAAVDLKTQDVHVPEWDCVVRVREWTAAQRAAIAKYRDQDAANLTARMLVLTLEDAEGNRIFTDEDIPALQAKSAVVLERLAGVVVDLNGLGEAGLAAAKKA